MNEGAQRVVLVVEAVGVARGFLLRDHGDGIRQDGVVQVFIARHGVRRYEWAAQKQPLEVYISGQELICGADQSEDLQTMSDEKLVLTLDGGDVVIKLRPDLAPGHVERIKELVGEGFYDGIKFHRVIPGFMAQGGCPQGTGMGGSSKPDLKAEFNAEPHVRGVCSMARTSYPHSANSQFFICFDDARFLDKQYTVWGVVESGMEHVDALPKGEPPAKPGVIHKAAIVAA